MKTDKHARSPVSPEMQCMMWLVTRKKCKIFETDGCPLFLVSKRGDSRVCWPLTTNGGRAKNGKTVCENERKIQNRKRRGANPTHEPSLCILRPPVPSVPLFLFQTRSPQISKSVVPSSNDDAELLPSLKTPQFPSPMLSSPPLCPLTSLVLLLLV